jgi:sugar lactone lactonase YvrE
MHPETLQGQTITTIAGCGIGDDSLATRAELDRPVAVALDHSGNTYIADYDNGLVRKVNASGIISTLAGGSGPSGVAVDRAENVYIAFSGNNLILKVSPTGTVSTIAGTATSGYNGDGIPATSAKLNYPADVAVDTAGNIYIADEDNYRVRKVNPSGIISTVAGNGVYGFSGMGGPAPASSISHPYRVALDKTGNLYIGDVGTYHIYKVGTADTITSFMGTGAYGFTGDGGPATAAQMSYADGLVTDTVGNLYVSDRNNCRIRVVNAATGIVNTMYGTGIGGYSGDGSPAATTELNTPQGLAFDSLGNLFICDYYSNRVREVNTSGIISTFAGQSGLFGEGYPAVNAELGFIINLTIDAAGNIYLADIDNHRIRMINAATGAITTMAGCGISGQQDNFSGDGGPATAAHLYFPNTMAFDRAGNMYICDQSNERIRMVSASGIISTFAGNGTAGFVDNVPATDAEFGNPTGVVVDKAGNVYISDNNNHCIRKVDASTGIITTVAGNGFAGYSGDGGPATNAELNHPYDVAVDGQGNLYISDGDNYCIRMVDTMGNISTVAGNGTLGFSGDGGPAVDAQMRALWGIKVDSAGDIIIADDDNQRIRLVHTNGIITTIAGNGTAGFSGDGGPALDAGLAYPKGVAFDLAGNLYIADNNNRRIRKTSLTSLAAPQSNKPALTNVFTYPNPTVGIVTIMNAANCDAVLYDVLGKQVMQVAITNNKKTLDLSNLAGGVYVFQVTNKNAERKMLKITKE